MSETAATARLCPDCFTLFTPSTAVCSLCSCSALVPIEETEPGSALKRGPSGLIPNSPVPRPIKKPAVSPSPLPPDHPTPPSYLETVTADLVEILSFYSFSVLCRIPSEMESRVVASAGGSLFKKLDDRFKVHLTLVPGETLSVRTDERRAYCCQVCFCGIFALFSSRENTMNFKNALNVWVGGLKGAGAPQFGSIGRLEGAPKEVHVSGAFE
uniref:Uncharacterized protein n=1 Tax=Chromera velia CCMP2878 TaxID=1169474 RepID=A0A0G4HZG6_9ALVE|eukprot:Cvel_9731.t1-p1 / transcript=Cvel_9731.t1 / gene=Cvel_9731 / organism=Chromera_velia_CCMP2878 / gene_product=hypothetical protein / transcript_product=hypothetical protein / location=Cvel_scaffold568:76593-77228(+) / protein_length=212 / sequence_SO=supercontig / SO=protein_coding / is_pseudo=false